MLCPLCHVEMNDAQVGETDTLTIDQCPTCEGMFFDKGELDHMDESVWTDVETLEFLVVDPEADHEGMSCTRCEGDFEPISPKDMPSLVLDRCQSCGGYWLDKGELESVRDLATEEDADSVDEVHVYPPNLDKIQPPDWSWLRWQLFRISRVVGQINP